MNKIKSSNVLKGISFVLIPILVLILAFSIFHMLFLHEYGNESKEYTKTENFSTAYFRFVLNQVTRAQNVSSEESNNYLELDFVELFKTYNDKYPLLEEEKMLLFILLSIPKKVEFEDNEMESCKKLRKQLDYIYKTENLIKEFYKVNNPQ